MEPPLRHPAARPSDDRRRLDATAPDHSDMAGVWALALALLEPDPTFGVYDEGDGLLSLYVTPFLPRTLAKALEALQLGGVLHDVTPTWGLSHARPITLDAVRRATAPLELIHSATSAPLPAADVLAAPHAALAVGTGRELAISLHEQHGVLYARDPSLLKVILETWIREHVSAQSSGGVSPSVLSSALPSVLEPIPHDAFRRVVLEEEPRFWWLDLDAVVADETGDEIVVAPLRWVGGPDRPWRAGWSW